MKNERALRFHSPGKKELKELKKERVLVPILFTFLKETIGESASNKREES